MPNAHAMHDSESDATRMAHPATCMSFVLFVIIESILRKIDCNRAQRRLPQMT